MRRSIRLAILVLAVATVCRPVGAAVPVDLELLGEASLPTGLKVDNLEVGGLSGLAWDPARNLWIAVSDDRGVDDPIRFFTLRIDLEGGRLAAGGVTVVSATVLHDADGAPLPSWSADLESIVRLADGTLIVGSEGDPPRGVAPFLARVSADGQMLASLPLPERYLPTEGRGVRTNLAFESMTLTEGGRMLLTATENALAQDGPEAAPGQGSPSRILELELPEGRVEAEYVYPVDPVPVALRPGGGFSTNGLSELLALPDGGLLALERWFAAGVGHGAKLYRVDLEGATDIAGVENLADAGNVVPATKRLVLDLNTLGIALDNLEGMALGPELPDGRRLLVLISDNNFKPEVQWTQVLAFAIGTRRGTRIMDVQGADHISPLLGEWVPGVEGVVTEVRARGGDRGFWFQDPVGDGDPDTSDGLFVAPAGALEVAPGDRVRVEGRVAEVGRPDDLPATRLAEARVEILGHGAPLPPAVVLGAAGRPLPGRNAEDDGLAVFDPGEDAVDTFEALEGMRVRIDRARVVGPTSHYGEIVVVADDGIAAGPWTARGGLLGTADDPNPEALTVVGPGAPAVRVGDHFAGPLEGVLDAAFGGYRLVVDSFPKLVPGGLEAESTKLGSAPGRLTMATFNVENLWPGSDRLPHVGRVIAVQLGAPAVVALEEIQDDSGPTDDGTVTAAKTLDALVEAVVAAGGPRYDWLALDPHNNQEGGRPGGNIRVALLVDPARVRAVRRGPGGARPVEVEPGPTLAASPARLEHPAFAEDPERGFFAARRPLVAELEAAGRPLFVVVVHLSSKGGDDPMLGLHQPPRRSSEAQRREQAFAVRALADRLLAADPTARIVILGDFNERQDRPPMRALEGGGLVNLTWRLPENERYSYVFRGSGEDIDHVVVSPSLAPGSEIDVVHVDAEFPDGERASDHDPVVVRLVVAPGPR